MIRTVTPSTSAFPNLLRFLHLPFIFIGQRLSNQTQSSWLVIVIALFLSINDDSILTPATTDTLTAIHVFTFEQ